MGLFSGGHSFQTCSPMRNDPMQARPPGVRIASINSRIRSRFALIKSIAGLNQYQLEAYNVSSHIVYVSDASFDEEVLKASGPVLVDYWAEWCGPCKMIAPILDEIATEYTGKIKVAKLNIDENPQTPPRYGIRGIPTLMLFKNGSVEATKVGAVSKSQLTAFIDSNL
jgi:thioredoxin 1